MQNNDADTFLARQFPVLRRLITPRAGAWILLAGLYAAGILHWRFIFASAIFHAKDWTLIAKYYCVLREAFTQFRVPYLMSYAGHYTDRFLAMPEIPFSPQFWLLPWLSDPAFHFLNICLLYTISFAGLIRIRNEHRLSAMPFVFLFLIYNFNGYLVSRVAIGHVMWYGYFFLPFLYLVLLRMADRPLSERDLLTIAFILLLMVLQGSFHLWIWCLMYLFLIGMLNPRVLPQMFYVGACAGCLCLFRLLPGAVVFWKGKLGFITGFPSLGWFADSLTVVRDFTGEYPFGPYKIGWWEFDCYIGAVGLGLLLYFVLQGYRHEARTGPNKYQAFDLACLAMVALSFGSAYTIFSELPVPLASSQRVASRFIVMPLTLWTVLAAIRMQACLDSGRASPLTKHFLWLCLILLAWGLYTHSAAWRIFDADYFFLLEHPYGAPEAHIVPPRLDDPGFRQYMLAVQGSAVFSAVAALLLALRFLRIRRRALNER